MTIKINEDIQKDLELNQNIISFAKNVINNITKKEIKKYIIKNNYYNVKTKKVVLAPQLHFECKFEEFDGLKISFVIYNGYYYKNPYYSPSLNTIYFNLNSQVSTELDLEKINKFYKNFSISDFKELFTGLLMDHKKKYISILVHELTHAIDKNNIQKWQRGGKNYEKYSKHGRHYYNSPAEYNALYQEVLLSLKNRYLDGINFENRMDVFKSIIDLEYKQWFSKLSENNKRRLIKDIAQYLKYHVD